MCKFLSQWLTICSPWDKYGLLPVFTGLCVRNLFFVIFKHLGKENLLKITWNSHYNLCSSEVWWQCNLLICSLVAHGCSCAAIAGLRNCHRGLMNHCWSLNTHFLALYKICLLCSAVRIQNERQNAAILFWSKNLLKLFELWFSSILLWKLKTEVPIGGCLLGHKTTLTV